MADQPEVTPEVTPEPVRSPGSLLADRMYKQPEPKHPEPEQPDAIDEPDEQEDLSAAAEGETEGEVLELSTLDDLAKAYELDPESLMKLAVTRKVNGKEVKTSLFDALETFDKVKAADSYLSDAKEKSKAMLAEASQQQEQLTGSVAAFGKLVQTLESELQRDQKDMDQLRKDDPAEWGARQREFDERRSRIESLKREAGEEYKKVAASYQQQSEEQIWEDRRQRAPQEKEILLSTFPEWKDESKWQSEQEKAVQYMRDKGATPQQIENTLFDGKVLSTIVKAMRYDEGKAKADTAKKNQGTKPLKVLKPGSKSSPNPKANGKDKDRVSRWYG